MLGRQVKIFFTLIAVIAAAIATALFPEVWKFALVAFFAFVIGLLIDVDVSQDVNKAYNLTALREGISNLKSGERFESFMHEYFQARKYKVLQTAATGDFGADLVLQKRRIRTVVQCKLYSQPVGVKAVQEVVGAKNMYSASQALVVTNSTFTKAAVDLALVHRVELWDGKILCEKLYLVRSVRKVMNEEDVRSMKFCPLCQSKVNTIRTKAGLLVYCKHFPDKCDYLRIVV